jgi:hypothetical protein
MSKLIISKIPNLNVLIIKLTPDSKFFLSTRDSVIISIPNFALLLKYLVKGGFISIKVLEGIISELKE